MRKVKWGALGTADIARGCTIPGLQKAENCELTAIAGRSMEKANAFKEQFGFEKAYGDYESLLADEEVEAIYIPLPNHLHYEWVMKAIAAGKNVLCEKPLAPTAKEAEELFAAAEAKGVILMEAFAYLHSPYIAAVKEDVAKLGEISYLETAFMTAYYNPGNIRLEKEMYGGSVYDLGCYCTSMALWMLDEEPESVSALADYTEKEIDAFATALFKYKNGARASLTCGMVFDKDHPSRMDRLYVRGKNGYIASDVGYNVDGELKYTLCLDGKCEERIVFAPHNYSLEAAQLSRCIAEGEKPHVSKEFSIRNARCLDAILREIGY